jgi:hypothetical protein
MATSCDRMVYVNVRYSYPSVFANLLFVVGIQTIHEFSVKNFPWRIFATFTQLFSKYPTRNKSVGLSPLNNAPKWKEN